MVLYLLTICTISKREITQFSLLKKNNSNYSYAKFVLKRILALNTDIQDFSEQIRYNEG